MLTQRHRDVLGLVVGTYIEGGEPVSSKTVSERSRLGVSAATIRGAMAELEEQGFLTHPHISAGRVPTDAGFRFYVDSLLEVTSLGREEKEQILRACDQGNRHLDDVLVRVSRVLSTLTLNACMVRAPDACHAILRRIQFIRLAGRSGRDRILALLISDSGQLRSRLFPFQNSPSQEKLDRFGQALGCHLEGMTLSEVRAHLRHEVEQGTAEYRLFCSHLLENFSHFPVDGGLIVNGRMNLFRSFVGLTTIRDLLAILEEKKGLIRLLDQCLGGDGVRLFIGSEAALGHIENCTVVAAPFGKSAGGYPGTLGVLGPTRLDYAHVIPLVDFTTKALNALVADVNTVGG